MHIGEVAKLSGLSTRTIDYYTNCGLFPVERSEANYRLYPATVLQTIERIQLLKKQRMSIAEIKQILVTNENLETELLMREVHEEFDCLQKKLARLEEQLKDAPTHLKVNIHKTLETRLLSIASLLTLM
ncbi:MerR family transcriptional regulator [Psychrobacillus soli]|uniref:MerR family transcriptional regulator n=1 Tax=Psychrobacillus soli TaxID=1543965 RepID=A0A544T7A3_9BACI|nr:MerR family transcriptional regulator [Psychrobacillus soli]TQR13335.1 MerR family transcriptional regulator [Psychrobacillus soli]